MERPALDAAASADPTDTTTERMRRETFPAGRIVALCVLVAAAMAPLAWWQRSHDVAVSGIGFDDSCARAEARGVLVLVAFAEDADADGAALQALLCDSDVAARVQRCATRHLVLADDPERRELKSRFGVTALPALVLARNDGAAIGEPVVSPTPASISALLDRTRSEPRAGVRRLEASRG